MNENARIWYQQEEKVFLERHPEYPQTYQIFIVKTPDVHVGKIDIPRDKKQPDKQNGAEKCFPVLDEIHPLALKTEQKGNRKT